MRKFLLIITVAALAATAAACSSSSHKAAAPTTTATASTTVDAATKAKACGPIRQLKALSIGTTPAEYKAAATKMRALAAQIPATALPSHAAAAAAEQKDIDTGLDQLAAATTKAEAAHALANAFLVKDPAAADYTDWVSANCLN